ncbi:MULTISPECIES: TIGR02611 family protein [unclassified Streptomyces]|uniref:TIGR02611 family protein n=1 Tax=unclassified Streptomyces TaxID=2593676 RepID=UPI001F038634|nr:MULTISPECIES: TIGR02611 family protein [unclassified Streptomyces]MCH0565629.1 TIGR02611 family protein [Streptomyces sp. MUM 2J]MCH0573336.1 TIGR02611 family protein [Streptomyces sp. MUM 136J]
MNTGSDEPGEAAVATDGAKVGEDETGGTAGEQGLGSRAPEFVKARRALHVSWQVGVFVVGLAVVVAGVIMLPLPGPGWVVIFGGMAIWATEFVWAQLVLRWTKRKVTEAAQRALDPEVRRRNIILTATGLVIVVAIVGVYLWKFGLVMPWKIEDQ